MVFIPRETYRLHPLWHCSLWGPLSLWWAESLTSTENRGNKLPSSSIIELWDNCLVFISSGYVLMRHTDVFVLCLVFGFWIAHLSWPWTQYGIRDNPEVLLTLLPPLPECGDYRCVPPHLIFIAVVNIDLRALCMLNNCVACKRFLVQFLVPS